MQKAWENGVILSKFDEISFRENQKFHKSFRENENPHQIWHWYRMHGACHVIFILNIIFWEDNKKICVVKL
jgi:hypothetical protein